MQNQKDEKDEPGKPYDKSIRNRLTRTVLIPSITLLVLWTAVSSYFFLTGLYVRLVAVSVREVSIPAVTALSSLQQERQLALQYLDNPGLGKQRLQQQQSATDGQLASLQDAFASTISHAPDEIATKVNALKNQFDQLPVVRSQVNFRSIDRGQVNSFYNGVLDSASNLFDTQARVVPDVTATQGGITATSLFRASDMMSRETSLVSTAFASGAFTPDDFFQFSQLAGYYRTQLAQVVPFTQFSRDISGSVPRFVWITPNMCHDGHDCSTATADAWLAQTVPTILATKAWKEGGVLFLTWDEGEDSINSVLTIVIRPSATHRVSSHAYNHYNLLATIEDRFRLRRLGSAARAAAMTDLMA